MPTGTKKAKSAKTAKKAAAHKTAKPKSSKPKGKGGKATTPKQSRYMAAVAAAAMAILSAGTGGSTIVKHGDSFRLHCDNTLDAHVYHPGRLVGNHTCVMAIGTVEKVIPEGDGDWHIRLHLDEGKGQEWMLNPDNDANEQKQHGTLVLEVVCAGRVTQEDAIPFCKDFSNTIPRPHPDVHYAVVGKYVAVDKEHGWAELHPVSSITRV